MSAKKRPRRKRPWPKCCAPLCKKDADYSVHMSGDYGEFVGHLCRPHYDNLSACFNATYSNTAYLRPIIISARQRVREKEKSP